MAPAPVPGWSLRKALPPPWATPRRATLRQVELGVPDAPALHNYRPRDANPSASETRARSPVPCPRPSCRGGPRGRGPRRKGPPRGKDPPLPLGACAPPPPAVVAKTRRRRPLGSAARRPHWACSAPAGSVSRRWEAPHSPLPAVQPASPRGAGGGGSPAAGAVRQRALQNGGAAAALRLAMARGARRPPEWRRGVRSAAGVRRTGSCGGPGGRELIQARRPSIRGGRRTLGRLGWPRRW